MRKFKWKCTNLHHVGQSRPPRPCFRHLVHRLHGGQVSLLYIHMQQLAENPTQPPADTAALCFKKVREWQKKNVKKGVEEINIELKKKNLIVPSPYICFNNAVMQLFRGRCQRQKTLGSFEIFFGGGEVKWFGGRSTVQLRFVRLGPLFSSFPSSSRSDRWLERR